VRPGDSDDTTNPHGPIREVTVKSFSMSVHIRRPGFQLLSLVDPAKLANPSLKSFADTPCLLPDQYRIYTAFYAPCVLFTFLILVLLNISRARFHAFRTIPSPIHGSSGRASPNPMVNTDPGLWSAIWSPYTPTLPVSPPGTLPPHIRTSHTRAGTTTMLVASRPGSPSPVSPSFVVPYSDADEDEEDTLYPTKYTVRRDSHKLREDDGWSHVGRSKEEEGYEIVSDQEADGRNGAGHRIHSEFITAPDHARHLSFMKRQKGWSYTFMLGGQARRITLRLPTWTSLHNLFDLFGLSGSDLVPRRRRNSWMLVILDGLSVFWPAAIVWVIINWTIL
jgi:ethanolamine phosphate phosphodiesterase